LKRRTGDKAEGVGVGSETKGGKVIRMEGEKGYREGVGPRLTAGGQVTQRKGGERVRIGYGWVRRGSESRAT